jgi:hypothetical protein
MRYLATEKCTDFAPLGALERRMPLNANPDFYDQFPLIKRWYVELDESGAAVRELGFDVEGRAILAAPFRGNFGFWTDANPPFPDEGAIPIGADAFESAWAGFIRGFQGAGLRPDDA